MPLTRQSLLFPDLETPQLRKAATSTFVPNMSLPVHRWFRYSAGFSAQWVESVVKEQSSKHEVTVFDPFAGSGTTLLAAQAAGARSWGVEAHPFVYRVAKAKLACRTKPEKYQERIAALKRAAVSLRPQVDSYPPLIRKCYDNEALGQLDVIRQAFDFVKDDTPASELLWLTIVAMLRQVSHVGTAQWQYVLPKKSKKKHLEPLKALDTYSQMILEDMGLQRNAAPKAKLLCEDARLCSGVPDGVANLVITSPPYPNNYDYADATRLEMSFFGEVRGWGDLQEKVRQYLIVSCSQHVPEGTANLQAILQSPSLAPIASELKPVCESLAEIRLTKGGKKTYHLMIASYFRDLGLVFNALRRVCSSPSKVCFVIGDSAPYGVYVPVIPWLGKLALASGFKGFSFEKTRDRNIKWKNRKHRVPLQEGQLWIDG